MQLDELLRRLREMARTVAMMPGHWELELTIRIRRGAVRIESAKTRQMTEQEVAEWERAWGWVGL